MSFVGVVDRLAVGVRLVVLSNWLGVSADVVERLCARVRLGWPERPGDDAWWFLAVLGCGCGCGSRASSPELAGVSAWLRRWRLCWSGWRGCEGRNLEATRLWQTARPPARHRRRESGPAASVADARGGRWSERRTDLLIGLVFEVLDLDRLRWAVPGSRNPGEPAARRGGAVT